MSALSVKRRPLPFGGGHSQSKGWDYNQSTKEWVPNPAYKSDRKYPANIGTQFTESETHSWPPISGSSGDVGGPFRTERRKGVQPNGIYVDSFDTYLSDGVTPSARYQMRFQIRCPIEMSSGGTQPNFPVSIASSQSAMNTKGATAISRCKPTSSAAELSVALGEAYRDGLPALIGHTSWRERTLRARNAGDEYLNVQFGWVPLVRDVTDFAGAVTNSHDILEQYRADKGKTIRRQYSFPEVREVSETYLGKAMPEGISLSVGARPNVPGDWVKKTTRVTNAWFSGAFVYGVPNSVYSGSGIAETAAEADKLLGISLTPDVLWNLSPWSWAVDWFTNTGDVLSTLSDFVSQGLVMQYGYLMEHTVHKVEYSLTNCRIHGRPVSVPPASLTTEVKTRARANPFGFGISWDGLSATQAAILAALGISRS